MFNFISSSLHSSSSTILITLRNATKKAGGSTKNGRDSIGKRLGLKKPAGAYCSTGNILVRQRGLTYGRGEGVGLGKDFTLFALQPGYLYFEKTAKKTMVHILPENKYKINEQA